MKGTIKPGKRKIERRLTVLCKLVIFLVVTGFSEIFIVRESSFNMTRGDEDIKTRSLKF